MQDTLNTGFIRSERLRLNYTGSIVIAYDHEKRYHPADFLESYVSFDEAMELYFIDGELAEERVLQDAIHEWKETEERITRKNRNRPEIMADLWNHKKEIAIKYLKYEYGIGYKWMY